MKSKIKKIIIYPLTLFIITSGQSFASQIYKIGETSKGNIYWGNREYNSSYFSANDTEINTYILDKRRGNSNPEVVLYNSHNLDIFDIMEICKLICEIEKIDPTDFDRDYESLVLEWIFHHTAYQFGYKINHSKDVNFDNNDKELYEELSKKFKIHNILEILEESHNHQKIK